jgi:hypothetical protein
MNRGEILILGLVAINLVAVDVLIANTWNKPKTVETKTVVETKYIYPTTSNVATPTVAIPSPTLTLITKKTTKNTLIVPIPGSGSTENNSWTDLSGTEFNLNTNDYPNISGAYMEVNMRLFNGNGMAFVRLFDVTAGIEVWGGEVKTNNQNFTAVTSDKLILRPGNHLYRIQVKSLTADTTVYNSGRIRIVTEN